VNNLSRNIAIDMNRKGLEDLVGRMGKTNNENGRGPCVYKVSTKKKTLEEGF
jgi:hypothetical protein